MKGWLGMLRRGEGWVEEEGTRRVLEGREEAAWRIVLAVVAGKVGLGGRWGSMGEVML